MNPTYRWKYDEMRSNQPADKETQPVENMGGERYGEAGHMRFLCFVWPDGRRVFLSYSYLISAEYLPDEGNIKLSFTTHVALLKGVRLERLFFDLMQQIVRQITCTEDRYNMVQDEENPIVNVIDLTESAQT